MITSMITTNSDLISDCYISSLNNLSHFCFIFLSCPCRKKFTQRQSLHPICCFGLPVISYINLLWMQGKTLIRITYILIVEEVQTLDIGCLNVVLYIAMPQIAHWKSQACFSMILDFSAYLNKSNTVWMCCICHLRVHHNIVTPHMNWVVILTLACSHSATFKCVMRSTQLATTVTRPFSIRIIIIFLHRTCRLSSLCVHYGYLSRCPLHFALRQNHYAVSKFHWTF